jgi:hypothetical protein
VRLAFYNRSIISKKSLMNFRFSSVSVTTVGVLLAMTSSTVTVAQEICDFISLATITSKFPASAPWRVTNGGSGACAFEGQQREDGTIRSVILNFTQQVQDTPQEAVEMMRTMREEFVEEYDLEKNPKLGSEGFYMLPKGKPVKDSLSWWSHRGRMVLSGLMLTPGDGRISAADRENLTDVLSTTLALTAAPRAHAKAAQCPYFDDAILKKLLPGAKQKVQQFGNNSCLAEGDNGVIVMLTRLEARSKDTFMSQTKNEAKACATEQPTGMGDAAFLTHACTHGGNPSASIKFLKGNFAFDVSLLPGKEPTAAQRAELVSLGRHIFGLK